MNIELEDDFKLATDENSIKMINGFRINWMKMKDAEKGKTLWECTNWETNILNRSEVFPKAILECRSVGREINFTSKELIQDFKLVQKVWLFGQVAEEWNFHFGFVIPNSTNTWEQIIVAADVDDMLPPEVLNGNMRIETLFFNGNSLLYRSNMMVNYE